MLIAKIIEVLNQHTGRIVIYPGFIVKYIELL
jgi:hypothetical protein